MPDETDDSDEAASRLEAALDRIARATAQATGQATSGQDGINAAHVAARLDSLIGRLRAELGGTA